MIEYKLIDLNKKRKESFSFFIDWVLKGVVFVVNFLYENGFFGNDTSKE